MLPHIIFITMAILTGIVGIMLVLINVLYDHFSEITNATIIGVEMKYKYHDSSYDKKLAYDYVYEYKDSYGEKFTGKIISSSSNKEFSEGDVISVRYLEKFPAVSMYKKIPLNPYVVIAMSVILFLINLII